MSTEEVPIRELLSRLNALRADVGKPHLANWKGSRTNLVNAIDTVKAEAEAALEERIAAVENGPSVLEGHPLHTEMKALDEAKKPSRKDKQRRAERTDKSTFTLSELAAELDIQPKIARAKARRNKDKLAGYLTEGEGWVFLTKYRTEVTKLIK